MAKTKRRRAKKRPKKNKLTKNLWIYFLTIPFFIYLISGWEGSANLKQISYSELKTAVSSSSIKKVTIGETNITAIPHDKDKKKLRAKLIQDDQLIPLLEKTNTEFEGVTEKTWLGEILFSWVLPILFIFFLWQFFMGRAMKNGGPPGLLSFGKNKAKLVDNKGKSKVTFKDVAGAEEVKEELMEIISFLKAPLKFTEIGGKIPKGVLLVGPPGTGKTLLARAVAGESKVPFFQLSGSDFVEMFVGVGAARVRDLFKEATKNSPCIIFIDELDAIAKSRNQSGFGSNDERENTLNQILVEMDGFDNHKGIIIIGATNRPEVLDPAILRPGRFDRQVIVDAPDVSDRVAILKVHAKTVKLEDNINLKDIASRTPGFTGADLANLINESALLAVRKGLKKVDQTCIEEAVDRIIAGLKRKSRVLVEDEKFTVAVHEVGHAIVARHSGNTDKVHRISIIPRSKGSLGFTLQIPDEERHLQTEKKLREKIRILLGGRAAEKVVIGSVTTGAYDDLKRASEIARRMLTEFGMGKSLGLVSIAQSNEMYKNNPFAQNGQEVISETTAQKIDAELQSILSFEFDKAISIINEHKKTLDDTVKSLITKETLESDDIKELLG